MKRKPKKDYNQDANTRPVFIPDEWCQHPGDDYILINVGAAPQRYQGDNDFIRDWKTPKARICPLCGLPKRAKDESS